jgi:hypothetical protein
MQEVFDPHDPGFVVDWQLADAHFDMIDLSAEQPDADVVLADDTRVRTGPGG